jgi:hypothetical protein
MDPVAGHLSIENIDNSFFLRGYTQQEIEYD